ncbi:hypothetical protein EVAR_48119_1 [Eumeta japonica]|uniref:Uncharacterized protein n=1 Tax=Eumeta variegata TaxID=151549 RepID=A0A4C2A710_EUMVA|nr:hypothetical protein EVAR_48119_1 [Eumeta japonica]
MTSNCAVSGRTGCPAPLKWLSWTMADRPVVLVNGCRATGIRAGAEHKESKSKLPEVAKPQTPGHCRSHSLFRYANHTSDQVVKAIRDVVDAREVGVGVDRVRKAGNQKVVLSCAPQEAIKRTEVRIKIRSKDLQVSNLSKPP